jgi:hypothetical protein
MRMRRNQQGELMGACRAEQLVQLIRNRRMSFPGGVIGGMGAVYQYRDVVGEFQKNSIAVLFGADIEQMYLERIGHDARLWIPARWLSTMPLSGRRHGCTEIARFSKMHNRGPDDRRRRVDFLFRRESAQTESDRRARLLVGQSDGAQHV